MRVGERAARCTALVSGARARHLRKLQPQDIPLARGGIESVQSHRRDAACEVLGDSAGAAVSPVEKPFAPSLPAGHFKASCAAVRHRVFVLAIVHRSLQLGVDELAVPGRAVAPQPSSLLGQARVLGVVPRVVGLLLIALVVSTDEDRIRHARLPGRLPQLSIVALVSNRRKVAAYCLAELLRLVPFLSTNHIAESEEKDESQPEATAYQRERHHLDPVASGQLEAIETIAR